MAPIRMQRVALVAPADALRSMLVRIAAAGVVELDEPASGDPTRTPAAELLHGLQSATTTPMVSESRPDLDRLVHDRRVDLLAGEASLEQYMAQAVRRGSVAAIVGWCPEPELPDLTDSLAEVEAAAVPLPMPAGVDPPTLLRTNGRMRRSFSTLVSTYGIVPYRDVDPTMLAGLAYIVMFGMMFGDVGHGLLLLFGALLLRAGIPSRWPVLRTAWPFIAGAGLASMAFGALYGEFFGPTGVVPVLWLAPIESPIPLLMAGIAFGAILLSGAYVVAIINRWREGGPRLAVYASSGIAGAALFLSLGLLTGGLYLPNAVLFALGVLVGVTGLTLAAIGFYAETDGGTGGVIQTVVELVDSVVRLGSNIFSFARLAAFGLAHAALTSMVWDATVTVADVGAPYVALAVLIFVVGNAIAFGLEGLIAAIQALRLEFYELFSRTFQREGRPFVPLLIPLSTADDARRQETIR
ncbi:MAG: V-type ATPase 116kDa subunit family protein [Nocardioidaceae bacterium]